MDKTAGSLMEIRRTLRFYSPYKGRQVIDIGTQDFNRMCDEEELQERVESYREIHGHSPSRQECPDFPECLMCKIRRECV